MVFTLETLFKDSMVVKAIIDRVMQTMLDTIFWKRYLDFEETKSRTFKTYLGTVTGVTMGSVIDRNSNKPLRERKDLGSGVGMVAYLGNRYQMDNDRLDMLKSLIDKYNTAKTADQVQALNAIIEYITDDLRQCLLAPHKRMDYVLGQLRSTGKASITNSNNRDGVEVMDIELPINDYYYFLAYIIGKQRIDNNRTIARMYGYTEILPGQITTDIIRSQSGGTYFDLVNNIVKGKFDFVSGLLSGLIEIYDNENKVAAGLSGDTNVGMWLGGSLAQAQEGNTNIILRKDGTAKIGIFEVSDEDIKIKTSENYVVITSKKIEEAFVQPKYNYISIGAFNFSGYSGENSSGGIFNEDIPTSIITLNSGYIAVSTNITISPAPNPNDGMWDAYWRGTTQITIEFYKNSMLVYSTNKESEILTVGEFPYRFSSNQGAGTFYQVFSTNIPASNEIINDMLNKNDNYGVRVRVQFSNKGSIVGVPSNTNYTSVDFTSSSVNAIPNKITLVSSIKSIIYARNGFGITDGETYFLVGIDNKRDLVVRGTFPANSSTLEAGQLYVNSNTDNAIRVKR